MFGITKFNIGDLVKIHEDLSTRCTYCIIVGYSTKNIDSISHTIFKVLSKNRIYDVSSKHMSAVDKENYDKKI